MEGKMKNALIIDDDEGIGGAAKCILEYCGLKVCQAFNGKEGLELARATKPDLLIIDYYMPHLTGFEVFRLLKKD